jgi:hypothetical protein
LMPLAQPIVTPVRKPVDNGHTLRGHKLAAVMI